MKNYSLLFISFFVYFLASSQIKTKDFKITYGVEKGGSDFISFSAVDGAGTVGSQAGVSYLWTLIDGKDTFQWMNNNESKYILRDSMEKTYSVCLKAYTINDTFRICKDFTVYPYLHHKSIYHIRHFFYNDKNNNCKQDAGEELLRLPAKYTSGKYISFNNIYSTNDTIYNDISKGTYTITSNSKCAEIICTTNQLIVDSVHENIVQAFPVKLLKGAYDFGLILSQTTGWNPGYEGTLNISVYNNGIVGKYAYIHLSKPDSITYISSDETATSSNAKMVHWKLYVGAGETKEINASFLISHYTYTNVDSVLLSALCDSLATDVDTSNNRNASFFHLDGSYDPNYKEVLSPDALNNDLPLEYKIHFQNTGDAPARNIVVADDLPVETDPESLTVLSSSHPMFTRITGNKAEFIFENIMLPDSGTDLIGSNGYVQFRIQLVKKQSGPQYALVKNKANIYFDFNAPVVTDEAVIYARVKANTFLFQPIKTAPFVIYPNPSAAGFYLTRTSTIADEVFTVLDINGRVLETVLVKSGQRIWACTVAANLPAGMYMIKSSGGATAKWVKD